MAQERGLAAGTLLTTPSTLSPAARSAIISNWIDPVYITGETGAVSQTVQNQLESTHVGNNSGQPFIDVAAPS